MKPVSKQAMVRLRAEYDLQEQNMLYLRHPYLTIVRGIIMRRNIVSEEIVFCRKNLLVILKNWENQRQKWQGGRITIWSTGGSLTSPLRSGYLVSRSRMCGISIL